MAPSTQTEIERKYAVDDEAILPAAAALAELAARSGGVSEVEVVALDPVQLEAVYFDTAAGALARERIALRRRVGGHDEGWHIKLPAVEGRTELQWPLATGDPVAPGVPAEVAESVRQHVRDDELTPLARIATRRTVTELRTAEGRVLAEIADDSVVTSDLRGGTVRVWREWEAELGPAAPGTPEARAALLDALEQLLLASGARPSPSVSKLAAALGRTGLGDPGTPLDELLPESAQATGVGAPGGSAPDRAPVTDSDAARRVRSGLRPLVRRLVELDPGLREDAPETVHRFRTTVRRLRNGLATHRRVFDAATVRELRAELAALGAVLGEVRDLEVRAAGAAAALDRLESDSGRAHPAARRRLVDDTLVERGQALERLWAWLAQPRYFRLLDRLEAFVDETAPIGARSAAPDRAGKPRKGKKAAADQRAARPARESAAALARERRRARRRRVTPRVAEQAFDADPLASTRAMTLVHRARKAARRLRHAAELASRGPGKAATHPAAVRALAAAAKTVQGALGRHRDAAVLAEFVLFTAPRAHAAGEDGFVYGALHERALAEARAALHDAERARRVLDRL